MKTYRLAICSAFLLAGFVVVGDQREVKAAPKIDTADLQAPAAPHPTVAPQGFAPDSFQATRLADGRTDIEWHVREASRLAFRLYREENGQRTPISPVITKAVSVPAKSVDGMGLSYTWWDQTAPRDGAVSYWLEYVNSKKQRNWVGPVVLVARDSR